MGCQEAGVEAGRAVRRLLPSIAQGRADDGSDGWRCSWPDGNGHRVCSEGKIHWACGGEESNQG